MGRTPYLLAGRPDLPANTLAELVDLARRNKNKPLTHGHIGQGSMIHLLGEQWARKSGIELGQIPYKGVPPVVQDLMGGQIDLTFLPMGGSTPTLVESGKVRVFGVTSAEASRRLPKVMPLSRQATGLIISPLIRRPARPPRSASNLPTTRSLTWTKTAARRGWSCLLVRRNGRSHP